MIIPKNQQTFRIIYGKGVVAHLNKRHFGRLPQFLLEKELDSFTAQIRAKSRLRVRRNTGKSELMVDMSYPH